MHRKEEVLYTKNQSKSEMISKSLKVVNMLVIPIYYFRNLGVSLYSPHLQMCASRTAILSLCVCTTHINVVNLQNRLFSPLHWVISTVYKRLSEKYKKECELHGARIFRFRQVCTLYFAYFHFAKNLVSISPSDSGRFNPTFRHVFRFLQVRYLAKFSISPSLQREKLVGEMYKVGEMKKLAEST